MLAVDGAFVRFGDTTAVDGVDLEVGAGETVAILGPSGCGKTTLLRAIAGLQPLDAGRITWDGEDLASVPPHRRRFGLMFQEYASFPHRDVAGNVVFGLRMAGTNREERERRVGEVLDLVGLRELRDRRVAELSGGEQQRVALARALAVEPRLLMLDEPLGALDRPWRERLLGEFRALLDRTGLPAIYVTHDHEEAFALADRIVVMRAGTVVQTGPPAGVWARPADPWTAAFLGFAPAVEARRTAAGVDTPWGVLPIDPRAGDQGDGGPVQVVLRPDALRIDPSGTVRATVAHVAFAGELADLELESGGRSLRLGVPFRDASPAGGTVTLAVDPDGVLVYPADEQGRLTIVAIPAKVQDAAHELAKRDRVLRQMMKQHGPPDLHRAKPNATHFAELARMICYQQLAGRAASVIHGRFAALFDGPPTPEAVLGLSMEQLRSVGLSGSKAASITDLAEKVDAGVVELDRMNRLPDEQVVRELVLVRGIGEWTAHMFLMFQCGRLDVWPIGDYGVRNGFALMYGIDPMPTPKVLEPLGEPFRPYRSLVAWWCWRAADTTTPT